MKIIQDNGPGPGFTQDEWTRGICYLVGGLAKGGILENIMIEAQRREPPRGFEGDDWMMFLTIAEVDLTRASNKMNGTMRCSEEKRGLSPSTPDMMKKAETSLELPRQPGELVEEEERRRKAVERLRNPPQMTNNAVM
jgi:hypothetical protein